MVGMTPVEFTVNGKGDDAQNQHAQCGGHGNNE